MSKPSQNSLRGNPRELQLAASDQIAMSPFPTQPMTYQGVSLRDPRVDLMSLRKTSMSFYPIKVPGSDSHVKPDGHFKDVAKYISNQNNSSETDVEFMSNLPDHQKFLTNLNRSWNEKDKKNKNIKKNSMSHGGP